MVQTRDSISEAETGHRIRSRRWGTPRTFFSDFRPGPWHTSATSYYARESKIVQATASNCQEHSANSTVLYTAIGADQGHVVAALQYAVVLKFAIDRSARVVREGFRENFLDRAR